MFVCCGCCVLLGTGLCDELITRSVESYGLWFVVVCDLETSRMRRPWPALGRSATRKKSVCVCVCVCVNFTNLLLTVATFLRCSSMFMLGPAVDSFQLESDGATEKYIKKK
jgi:hypothetical protein